MDEMNFVLSVAVSVWNAVNAERTAPGTWERALDDLREKTPAGAESLTRIAEEMRPRAIALLNMLPPTL